MTAERLLMRIVCAGWSCLVPLSVSGPPIGPCGGEAARGSGGVCKRGNGVGTPVPSCKARRLMQLPRSRSRGGRKAVEGDAAATQAGGQTALRHDSCFFSRRKVSGTDQEESDHVNDDAQAQPRA